MKFPCMLSLLFASLFLFTSAYAQHSLQVDDGASHFSKIVAPSAPTTFTLPSGTGAAGQVLTSDGAGNTSWQPAGSFSPSFLYAYSLNFFFPGGFLIPIGVAVPFFGIGLNSGTAFTMGFNSATINETGTYQIDYSISVGSAQPGDFTLAVNGINALGTDYTCQPGSSTQGMAYLNLNAGDILQIVNNSGFGIIIGGFNFGFNATIASLRLARVK